MKTLTALMIARVESLKAGYAALIADAAAKNYPDTGEFGQWQRMNTLLSYLEDRLAR